MNHVPGILTERDAMLRKIISTGPDRTRAIAARLLAALGRGSVLSLHGELGSGKTCFVQGLAEALGVQQAVTSPSYTIVREYKGRLPLYHIDLYRMKSLEEALDIGLSDYLEGDGIAAVEWGERASDIFPSHTIHVTFQHLDDRDSRMITIEAPHGTISSNSLLSLTALCSSSSMT